MSGLNQPSSSPTASPLAGPSSSPPVLVDPNADAFNRLLHLEQAFEFVTQQLQQQQQATQAALNQAAAVRPLPAVVSSSSSQRPKAPPMSLFNGLMGTNGFAIDQWLRELNKQFAHYGPSHFPDDHSKIKFAATWLTGAALDWWENEERDYGATHNGASLMSNSYDYFVERVRDRYRPQLPAELARQRLKTLVQKGRVETYCNAYLTLVAHVPDRSEEDKIFDFRNGLDRALAFKVAEKQPKTLQEAMEIAIQAEPYVTPRSGALNFGNAGNRANFSNPPRSNPGAATNFGSAPMDLNALALLDLVHGQAEEAAAGTSPSSVEPSNSGVINNINASPTNTMQLLMAKLENMEHRLLAMNQSRPQSSNRSGKRDFVPGLTTDDIASLMKEGRCFRCKQKGHMKSACPQNRLKY